jgi:hypothetical protein
MRQLATVGSLGYQQSVGISTPFARATSRIVWPGVKVRGVPLSLIVGIGGDTGGTIAWTGE